MNSDPLIPRAKVVQPIRKEVKLEVRFKWVLAERCASDAPYRYVFEAVRSALAGAGLEEVSASLERGTILTRFRWMWVIPVVQRIAFYSAGLSVVVDADAQAGRGWFRKARDRKAVQLVNLLTASPFVGTDLDAAVAGHSEKVRPPQHSI